MHDSVRFLPLPEEYTEDVISLSPRASADAVINMQGKRLLELCKMCNLRIFNGRVGSDRILPRKTCFSYNGSSTVDLMLGSPSLFTYARDFVVHDTLVFSDHAPVSLSLIINTKPIILNTISRVEKTVWDNEKLHLYKENLLQQNCASMFTNMMD